MQYKLKDKKIDVWYSIMEKSESGVNVKKWYPLYDAKIWAFYQFNTGTTVLEGDLVRWMDERENVTFVINRHSDALPESNNIVIFRGKIYDIKAVDDYQGYTEDIKLACELATDQNTDKYKGLVIR